MNRKTLIAALLLSATLAGCASTPASKSAKTEQRNCRNAIIGATSQRVLRSYMQPDLTDHVGPVTVDTYVEAKVLLYYAHGRLIGTDCATGKLKRRAGTLTGIGRRYLAQAAAVHEGSV